MPVLFVQAFTGIFLLRVLLLYGLKLTTAVFTGVLPVSDLSLPYSSG